MGSILVAVVLAGCAAHRAPDARPTPPERIEAHLRAMPPIGIAGQVFVLVAELVDPREEVPCPGITWTWPNGTRSSHSGDCAPDERAQRYSAIQRGRLPAGDHHFRVTFDSEGRAWSADTTVLVH